MRYPSCACTRAARKLCGTAALAVLHGREHAENVADERDRCGARDGPFRSRPRVSSTTSRRVECPSRHQRHETGTENSRSSVTNDAMMGHPARWLLRALVVCKLLIADTDHRAHIARGAAGSRLGASRGARSATPGRGGGTPRRSCRARSAAIGSRVVPRPDRHVSPRATSRRCGFLLASRPRKIEPVEQVLWHKAAACWALSKPCSSSTLAHDDVPVPPCCACICRSHGQEMQSVGTRWACPMKSGFGPGGVSRAMNCSGRRMLARAPASSSVRHPPRCPSAGRWLTSRSATRPTLDSIARSGLPGRPRKRPTRPRPANRQGPGDEAWLVAERRSLDQLKYYSTNHPANPN
jgi:hypothetical protein